MDVAEILKDAGDQSPEDGNYDLFVNGDVAMKYTVYCHDMSRPEPLTYFNVNADENFSQVAGNAGLVGTEYRKIRFDPVRLELLPNDATFATTFATTSSDAALLGELAKTTDTSPGSNLPLGMAYQLAGAQRAAAGNIDLTGTGFAFSEDIDKTEYLCVEPTGGTSTVLIENDLTSYHVIAGSASADRSAVAGPHCAGLRANPWAVDAVPLEWSGFESK